MHDTLSEVLRAVRLRGAIFFTINACAPWVTEAPPSQVIAPHLMPGVDHVIEYHLIVSGSCWGSVLGGPPIRLEAGDVICFPQGDAHVISSEPGMRGTFDAATFLATQSAPLPIAISIQGGGVGGAEVICGFLGCDARPFNPLLAALPRVIHVRGSGNPNAVLRRLVELAVVESSMPRPGGRAMLSRLSELLFVEMVRQYIASQSNAELGWFAALSDHSIGRALHTLHERPAHAWTLHELAKQTGVSRTLLTERFARAVGMAPMQYLTQWRMQLAASLLRSTTSSLAEIADQVGYGSEAALSRAFKRRMGTAPALYRKENRAMG